MSRWAHLPPREQPQRERRAPSRYGAADPTPTPAAIPADPAPRERALVVFASEPRSVHAARASAHASEWERALDKETSQLESTGTVEEVDEIPRGRNLIDTMVLFKEKRG